MLKFEHSRKYASEYTPAPSFFQISKYATGFSNATLHTTPHRQPQKRATFNFIDKYGPIIMFLVLHFGINYTESCQLLSWSKMYLLPLHLLPFES